MPASLSVCIVQPPMAATIAENLPRLCAALVEAAADGADLVLFPECATTGFHRGLPGQCKPRMLTEAVQTLQRLCDQHAVAAVVGSPWPHDGGILNAAVVLRPGQIPLIAPKVGLTDSERRFFSVGPRASSWRLGGFRLATVLCREVADVDVLATHYAGQVDALLWPGYIAWSGGALDAGALARRLAVPILQCNWPESLNAPGAHVMGRSRLIGADGEVVATGPDGVGRAMWVLREVSVSALTDSRVQQA